jgi:hypothetical protein
MNKDTALRLALEALQTKGEHHPRVYAAMTAIKAALEANEFNPDWDTQAVLVEEIQRMAKRIEELEAKDEPYALEASMFSNDRVKIDPVTGNVSIGTPQRTLVGLTDEVVWEKVDMREHAEGNLGIGTAPPSQRKWVGLTDEEIVLFVAECAAYHQHTDIHFARAIEAKLRSKNT